MEGTIANVYVPNEMGINAAVRVRACDNICFTAGACRDRTPRSDRDPVSYEADAYVCESCCNPVWLRTTRSSEMHVRAIPLASARSIKMVVERIAVVAQDPFAAALQILSFQRPAAHAAGVVSPPPGKSNIKCSSRWLPSRRTMVQVPPSG